MALTDSLIAYWKLDESSGDAADSVGSFTLTNTNSVGYSTGKINNAADFGALNSTKWLNSSADTGITGGACSYSGWINITTAPVALRYCLVGQASSTNLISFELGYKEVAGTKTPFFHREKLGVGGTTDVGAAQDLGTGTWHHLVGTYDGTNMRMYVDGSLTAGPTSQTGNGSSTTQTNGFGIGEARQDGYLAYLSGLADEVGVWSRALTADEVTSLYNGGAGLAYPFTGATLSNLLLMGV